MKTFCVLKREADISSGTERDRDVHFFFKHIKFYRRNDEFKYTGCHEDQCFNVKLPKGNVPHRIKVP